LVAWYVIAYPAVLQNRVLLLFLLVSPASALAFPLLVLLWRQHARTVLMVLIALPLTVVIGRTARDLTDPTIPLAGPSACLESRSGVNLHLDGLLTGDFTRACSDSECTLDRFGGRLISAMAVIDVVADHQTYRLDFGVSVDPIGEPSPAVRLPGTFTLGPEPAPGGQPEVVAFVGVPTSSGTYRELASSGVIAFGPDGSGSVDAVVSYAGGETTVRGSWTCPSGVRALGG